jgi:hypothetical protein
MKKFTNVTSLPLFMLLALTSMLFFSSCSSNKPYYSFTPAPPAYVKKQTAPAEKITPVETDNTEADKSTLTASTAAQTTVLPEVAALTKTETQSSLITAARTAKSSSAATNVNAKQKLTLTQKIVLHKVQKQVKKLSNQAQAAAGPVSNRNAIALILIGIVLAIFATLIGSGLGNLFYTLGILLLLVGLVLLILNYV